MGQALALCRLSGRFFDGELTMMWPKFLMFWRILFGPLCAGSITISLVTLKDIVDAVILLMMPHVTGNVPFTAMLSVVPVISGVLPGHVLAVLMMAIAGLALWAMHDRSLDHRLVATFLLPQQTMLVITCAGAITAVIRGAYLDGYVPSGGGWFIMGDQTVRILLAPAYTVALVARAHAHERLQLCTSGSG
jgi:hypothetical protein